MKKFNEFLDGVARTMYDAAFNAAADGREWAERLFSWGDYEICVTVSSYGWPEVLIYSPEGEVTWMPNVTEAIAAAVPEWETGVYGDDGEPLPFRITLHRKLLITA